jgi:hypothetical protein
MYRFSPYIMRFCTLSRFLLIPKLPNHHSYLIILLFSSKRGTFHPVLLWHSASENRYLLYDSYITRAFILFDKQQNFLIIIYNDLLKPKYEIINKKNLICNFETPALKFVLCGGHEDEKQSEAQPAPLSKV